MDVAPLDGGVWEGSSPDQPLVSAAEEELFRECKEKDTGEERWNPRVRLSWNQVEVETSLESLIEQARIGRHLSTAKQRNKLVVICCDTEERMTTRGTLRRASNFLLGASGGRSSGGNFINALTFFSERRYSSGGL